MSDELLHVSSEHWRFTASPLVSFAGLHGSLMAFFPGLIIAGIISNFISGVWFYGFILFVFYLIFLIFAKMKKFTPAGYMRYLHCKYILRGEWRPDI